MRPRGWLEKNLNIDPRTLAGLAFQAGEDVHFNPYPQGDERHSTFAAEMERLHRGVERELHPLGIV